MTYILLFSIVVKVWDLRKWGPTPVLTLGHKKSCHAAFFAPDGSQVRERITGSCTGVKTFQIQIMA
jgi:hypothetical protein